VIFLTLHSLFLGLFNNWYQISYDISLRMRYYVHFDGILRETFKEAAMAHFKIFSHRIPGNTEEIHKTYLKVEFLFSEIST
jgi:hypothetical protein